MGFFNNVIYFFIYIEGHVVDSCPMATIYELIRAYTLELSFLFKIFYTFNAFCERQIYVKRELV